MGAGVRCSLSMVPTCSKFSKRRTRTYSRMRASSNSRRAIPFQIGLCWRGTGHGTMTPTRSYELPAARARTRGEDVIQVRKKGAVTSEMDSHTKKLIAAGNALQLAMLSNDRGTAQAEWEKIRICYGLDGASKHARHAWQVSSVVANYPALQHLFFYFELCVIEMKRPLRGRKRSLLKRNVGIPTSACPRS